MAPQCDVVMWWARQQIELQSLATRWRYTGRVVVHGRSTDELRAQWLEGKRRVGVTAGASAPAALVEQVIERLETTRRSKGDLARGRSRSGCVLAAAELAALASRAAWRY